MAKTHDLVVKTGEYQVGGQTKARYKNVGALFETEKGMYILLDRSFNPAGIDSKGDSIMISLFEPREKEQKPAKRVADLDEDLAPF